MSPSLRRVAALLPAFGVAVHVEHGTEAVATHGQGAFARAISRARRAFSRAAVMRSEHAGQALWPDDQDCTYGAWSEWSTCSATCGGGRHWRSRAKLIEQMGQGAWCNEGDNETALCNVEDCPVECFWADWGPWLGCSATCGGGFHTRSRDVLQEAKDRRCHGGHVQNRSCAAEECITDCEWNDWSPWSDCSVECGGGTRSRLRAPLDDEYNGRDCDGAARLEERCNVQECDQDCQWGPWERAKPCSRRCGGGQEIFVRGYMQKQAGNGDHCIGEPKKVKPCNTHPCPVDCVWSDWSEWSERCSVPGGGGSRSRTRSIVVNAAHDGKLCEGHAQDNTWCNTQPCPIDCEAEDWSDWGDCRGCGADAQQVRIRAVIKELYGGKPCKELGEKDTRACYIPHDGCSGEADANKAAAVSDGSAADDSDD